MNNTHATRLRLVAGLILAAAAAGVASVALFPRGAHACGGLFCDRPPDPFAPLPVAQTGENVVFAIDKDPAGGATTLTAHIQILYAGDAAKFSWVVPVDAVPTLSVGTDRLFTSLAAVTQPQFNSEYVVDGECLPQPGGPPVNAGNRGSGGSTASAPGTGGASGTAGGGVTVNFQGAVGPFDAAVISATDPVALKMWLSDNGYVVSDQASGLIDDYVRQGKPFVALKLLNGVGVSSIQPIVLTFKGTEPCVPLRLTAIAANPDMPVRLWVLADARAVPKNFFELKIDDARIDWRNRGSNYNALVQQAANEAGGNAFVAEYAGSSSIAARQLWFEGQFDLTALRAAETPPAYVQALLSLGLSNDSQTLPLLTQYIPMPAAVRAMGITSAQFYGNLGFYYAQFAFAPFDRAALTMEISTKIIEPRRLAQLMIDAHPYLTRLNTFISPEEMNVDPLFIVNRDLPDVALTRTATFRTMCGNRQFMACNAPVRLELPDGRMTWVGAGATGPTCIFPPYDVSGLQSLPAAEVAWQREESGEGTRAMDNTMKIRAGLEANNQSFATEQRLFPIPNQAGTGNTPSPDGGTVTPPGQIRGSGGGCECALGPYSTGTGLAFGVLLSAVGLSIARRRRPNKRIPLAPEGYQGDTTATERRG